MVIEFPYKPPYPMGGTDPEPEPRKYIVIAEARYEYEVEAVGEEEAREKARDMLHDSMMGTTYWEDMLEWSTKLK